MDNNLFETVLGNTEKDVEDIKKLMIINNGLLTELLNEVRQIKEKIPE